MARTLWSWDLATPGVRTGFLEARSGSFRKLLTAVPKIPLPWLYLRPSGVRIDLIGTCIRTLDITISLRLQCLSVSLPILAFLPLRRLVPDPLKQPLLRVSM